MAKNIYIITGQTSTSKSLTAQKLAHKYQCDIINADSRQIYKKLDIITNKDLPTTKFKKVFSVNNFDIGYYLYGKSKLWLYDIVDARNHFSSYDFQTCALLILKKLLAENDNVVIVGGTYFYLAHILYNLVTNNITADWKLRHELEKNSLSALQKKLKNLNTEQYKQMNESDIHNPRRLIRRIEILSQNPQFEIHKPDYKITLGDKLHLDKIAITFTGFYWANKQTYEHIIEERVEERLKNGALTEIEKLIADGYNSQDPGLQTIGYKQLIPRINKHIPQKQAVAQWITAELQYAKRQYTFMKKDPNICWVAR